MKEVSCRAIALYLRYLGAKGIQAERVLDGLSHDLQHFQNKNERVDWSVYVAFMKNTRQFLTDADYVNIGGSLANSPLFRAFGLFARVLFTPTDFYRWIVAPSSGGGNQLFTCVDGEYEHVGPGRCIIKMTVQSGYEPCLEFFLTSRGSYESLPVMLGGRTATVTLSQQGQTGFYDVRFVQTRSLLGWLKRVILWPLSLRETAKALKEAHETLQSRYRELDSAKQLVASQATQLQTAYTISHAVHSDIDISRTLETVAEAFVTIAHFAGAHVLVEGPPNREAWSGHVDSAPDLIRELEAGGSRIGHVSLWLADGADRNERIQLFETVAPTVAMALYGARAYSELLDAQQYLEQRVKSRTTELVAARDTLRDTVGQLEAAERARAQLVANMNHEIRTPLTLILLSIEELRRSEGRAPEEDRVLASVARNARKLLRLVDGLLLLAARDENKLAISPIVLDIGVLVAAVIDGFAPSARICDLTLRSTVPEGIAAEVDEAAVDRILSNLVSNAIKFTPPGGEIVIGIETTLEQIEVSVSDTGVGISDKFMSRVFGRFEQDARPIRPGGAGSGIGLSIVRDLSRAHCGDAEVDRLPVGTRFRVRLPRKAAPGILRAESDGGRVRRSTPSDFGLPTTESALVAATPLRRDQTILVVEDDDELRAHVVETLSKHHHVLPASDAESALVLAEAHRPDMLVSDVGLPGMDGLELTRRFRALPGNRLAPVLLLTAFATLEARLSGFEAGAVDYLTKPFEPHELEARVRAQLDRRKLALQLHESEKLAAIGTMTAGLAHEMRNPANALVNAIGPLIELLPVEVRPPDGPVSQLLEVIQDCSAQIGLLSRQLLGFRRGADLLLEPILAHTLVERGLAILQPALRGIEVRQHLGYTGTILCAPALLLQVIGNLLDNAAHAAQPKLPGAWIEISTFVDKNRFILEVADSGSGVPPALRERIFEPFFTTKPPGQGTGLGLSTSRQIAEQHDGALYVHPTSTGSVFRLELPLSRDEEAGATATG